MHPMSFLSTYPLPPNFMYSMNFLKLTHQIQDVLALYRGCGAILWSMVDPPGVTFLKKGDSSPADINCGVKMGRGDSIHSRE